VYKDREDKDNRRTIIFNNLKNMRLKCKLCTSSIKKHELENPDHYIEKSQWKIGCVEVLNWTEVHLYAKPRELQDRFWKEVRTIMCDWE